MPEIQFFMEEIMQVTITTNNNSRIIDVPATESDLYKEVGKMLLDIDIPNSMHVTTPVGEADYEITKRGTFTKDGKKMPSMYVKEKRNSILLPPDTYKEAYLTCINPASNNYKFYHFKPNGLDLNATYGRIGSQRGDAFGVKDLQTPYPIHMYWIRYYEKLSKGYKDESDIYLAPKVQTAQSSVKDTDIAMELYDILYQYAKGMVRKHLANSETVTVEQVKQSKAILNHLTELKTVKAFNTNLQKLLTISPRKTRYVNQLLANSPSDFQDIIDREADLIAAMEAVHTGAFGSFAENHIEVYVATDSQKQEVIEHLIPSLQSKVKRIWRIIPQKQQKDFNEYCKKNHIRYVRQMWHGSRNANWLSIVENSLKISSNVANGRMFGDGAYFALDPMKSFGYTSSRYAKWTHENEDSVYMGLFAVAYGKPKFVSTAHKYTQKDLLAEHKNCVHAQAGSSLRADEIIFYSEKAMVMNYLVEFSA